MKQIRMLTKVLLLATLFLPVVIQMVGQGSVPVVSNADPNDPLRWKVTRANPSPSPPTFLGLPQNVCLNATTPLMCSMGVNPAPTLYGWPNNTGWTANLSGLPTGARWIWAPNITGATTPANLQEYIFEKVFYMCDPPTGGTLSIAADNFAEVSINGTVLSPTSSSADFLTTYTVPASILFGSTVLPIPTVRPNKLTIKARNGAGCNEDNYQCNPAGIVVGATFTFMGTGECSGASRNYKTGEAEKIGDCPVGQIGPGTTQLCVCGYWMPEVTSCFVPPPPVTCAGATRPFNVGEVETQSCPTGQMASPSTHTCQSSGMWDRPLGICTAPPVTCPGLTGPVPVNTVEMVACPTGQVATPARTRTCMSTGQFGPVMGGPCVTPPPPPPPMLGAGAMCATNRGGTILGTCPPGTSCASRVIPAAPRPGWCPAVTVLRIVSIFGIFLIPTPEACDPKPTRTTDWFCDPG